MAFLLPGSNWTAELARLPQEFIENLSGGPTSGTTELSLGTLVVPAFAFPTRQVVYATWAGSPDASGAGSAFRFRVRAETLTGTELARGEWRTAAETSASNRYGFSTPRRLRLVAASTSATYVASIQNESGTGTITTFGALAAGLSVMVYPDLS